MPPLARPACGRVSSAAAVVTVRTPCGGADIGGQGGVAAACGDGALDNNDFVVFINLFFAGDSSADVGSQGGLAGSNGLFDNNDFIVFINRFFEGC